jgi:hypothetical protein
LKEPVGAKINIWDEDRTIVGVVKGSIFRLCTKRYLP